MATLDQVVERITAMPDLATYVNPGDIKFPDGYAPNVEPTGSKIPGPLPRADIVVMAYTSAEGIATADVLSPGSQVKSWANYTHNWSAFSEHLTGRSPARDARCMAYVQMIGLNGHRVLLVKSNLHLSTDDQTMPVKTLVQQIAFETQCSLFITTGTAGGVGTEALGDVVIGENVKLNLAKSEWASESYAQQKFASTGYQETTCLPYQDYLSMAVQQLIPQVAYPNLKDSGYAPRAAELVYGKDIETVGYFAFADTDDSYGVVADDPNVGVEEMDDGIVALAISEMTNGPKWVAIRNASDPQMGSGSLQEQKTEAEKIYVKYGYWTTVCSSLIVWGVICGLSKAAA